VIPRIRVDGTAVYTVAPGATLTIAGSGLTEVSRVLARGLAANIVSRSATALVVGLPAGLACGELALESASQPTVPAGRVVVGPGCLATLAGIEFGQVLSQPPAASRQRLVPGKKTWVRAYVAGNQAGLEAPDRGRILLDGTDIATLNEDQRAHLRRERLGFVFQAFHVLPHLTVAENVELPLRLLGRPDRARVEALLADVGLARLGTRMPAQLSGGQLQRVAIARALVHAPALILADEPTGNLDPATAERVLDVLLQQAHQQGAACLLVTHSQASAQRADRMLTLTLRGIAPAR
jgi:putative ABC transport system ATP-binding protein